MVAGSKVPWIPASAGMTADIYMGMTADIYMGMTADIYVGLTADILEGLMAGTTGFRSVEPRCSPRRPGYYSPWYSFSSRFMPFLETPPSTSMA